MNDDIVLLVVPRFLSSTRLKGCSCSVQRGVYIVKREKWKKMEPIVMSPDWIWSINYCGEIKVIEDLPTESIPILRQIENRDVYQQIKDLLSLKTVDLSVLEDIKSLNRYDLIELSLKNRIVLCQEKDRYPSDDELSL